MVIKIFHFSQSAILLNLCGNIIVAILCTVQKKKLMCDKLQ